MNEVNYGMSFDKIIPLPFKIILLINIVEFLWFSIVYICYEYAGINVLQILNFSYSAHNYTGLDHQVHSSGEFPTNLPADTKENKILLKGIRENFKRTLANTLICLFIFNLLRKFAKPENENSNYWIIDIVYYTVPLYSLIFNIYVIFYKYNSKGQRRLFTSTKRILIGKINSATMRTNDILISDSLMSCSKLVNDFGFFLWTYYYSDEVQYNVILEFIILFIPTLIRMKQCWFEYSTTKNTSHLLNLIKYSTGIGPLLINLYIKQTLNLLIPDNKEDVQQIAILKRLNNLNHIWYFLSILNSTYSFIWDVKMDWGFKLFDNVLNKSETVLLRPRGQLLFGAPFIYYLIIVIDFCLRFMWVLRFFVIQETSSSTSSHIYRAATFLFGYDIYSFGYNIVLTLEILRRWMWCCVKIESDWIKLHQNQYNFELDTFPTKG